MRFREIKRNPNPATHSSHALREQIPRVAGPEPLEPEDQGILNWQGQHGQQNNAPKASQNL